MTEEAVRYRVHLSESALARLEDSLVRGAATARRRLWDYVPLELGEVDQVAALSQEVRLLRKLVGLQDRLLACYRLGKQPGTVLDKLQRVRQKLAVLRGGNWP